MSTLLILYIHIRSGCELWLADILFLMLIFMSLHTCAFKKIVCIYANMHLICSSGSLITGSSLLQFNNLSLNIDPLIDVCIFYLFIYSFLSKTTFLQKKRRKKIWWAKLLWIEIMSKLWQHCVNKPGISRIHLWRLHWYPPSTASSLYGGIVFDISWQTFADMNDRGSCRNRIYR